MYKGERSTDVTVENWQSKYGEGFRWKDNAAWKDNAITYGEYTSKLKDELGAENVLLGLPANDTGTPDTSIENAENLEGIYVRSDA